jgi:hypothetical protein
MNRFSVISMTVLVFLAGSLTACNVPPCEPGGTETLDVRQVNTDGFGDTTNQYAWSMIAFKEKLYVSTLNTQDAIPGLALFFLGLPFPTYGTQVWRGDIYDGDLWAWEKVVDGGGGNPLHYGIRKMAVVGDYLYGVTANHTEGFDVWRTFDGVQWETVASGGFGNTNNTSGRGLCAFNGYLYVGAENRTEGAEIWRRSLDASGDFTAGSSWERIASGGLGYVANLFFSDFIVHGDYLYMGTMHPLGMQLWRTDGQGFELLFQNGYDDVLNTGAMKLALFNDRLYVGSMNWFTGFDLLVSEQNLDVYAGANPEMAFNRILKDDLAGGLSPYAWYLMPYNGRFYVGTFRLTGGFKLFSSVDGEHFELETEDSFGCRDQYGLRTMEEFKGRLMIGTAGMTPHRSCKILEVLPANGAPSYGQ